MKKQQIKSHYKSAEYALHLKRRQGYTLIELLIVMFLLVIVATLIAGILNSTITGTAKSKVASDLGQNGNYALSIVSDLISNAQDLQSVTDESQATYPSCVTSTSSGLTVKSLNLVGFDGGVTILACNDTGISPSYTISSNSASLIDTTRVKVVPGSCSFTCTQTDEYSIPRIDVTFQLYNANSTTYSDKITFSTSVAMRNQSIK